jgi:L-ribulose-5-phosphate 3-epimerase
MPRLKIGLCLRSLGTPLRRALPIAHKLAVAGLEIDATGDLSPAQLSQTGRRELKHLLRSHDLELAAIACPLRRGLGVPENQEARIDFIRQALSLSWDLGAKVVVIQPGPLPADLRSQEAGAGERRGVSPTWQDPRQTILEEALTILAKHADRVGSVLALETGLESGEHLRDFLATFDSGGLAASLNPGNLLIHGHDPYAAAQRLREKVAYVHAKDARLASASRDAQEVPLGHGDIDWLQLCGALEEIEYGGFVTIERTPGADPVGEAKAAVGFLQRILR